MKHMNRGTHVLARVAAAGVLGAATALTLAGAGCSAGVDPHRLDADRILHMAGEEAGQIDRPKKRLTRQLNVADRQITNSRIGDARATLAEAWRTLEAAPPPQAGAEDRLTDQERLAGWV